MIDAKSMAIHKMDLLTVIPAVSDAVDDDALPKPLTKPLTKPSEDSITHVQRELLQRPEHEVDGAAHGGPKSPLIGPKSVVRRNSLCDREKPDGDE